MKANEMNGYELVVGLEVHIQLNTNSKAFSSDVNRFGDEPNTNISPITLAHPGTLPKINRAHLEKALKLACAFDAQVNRANQFDRKNYFYPDLPKGYQITQDRLPYCSGGKVKFQSEGKEITIRLHHIHMEEDAGKTSHDLSSTHSLLDYNRAGTPLLEMVTEPDFRSAQEVHDFMAHIQRIVRYLEISDGNMEEGSMRCDCNVSIRPKGSDVYGERCEIKNVNSKKFARQAINYEFKRQYEMVSKGIQFSKQTLNFNPETGKTTPLRSKEDAHDYRYFPDPDLPPLLLSDDYLMRIKANMPMLPHQYERKLIDEYHLSEYNASELTRERLFADYFIDLAKEEDDFDLLAKTIVNKIIPGITDANLSIESQLVSNSRFLEFISLIKEGKVAPSAANQILFPEMIAHPKEDLTQIAERLSLIKSDDQSFLSEIIDEVISNHPEELKKYRKGNKGLVGFFMGQVMRASEGKADPKLLKTELMNKLND